MKVFLRILLIAVVLAVLFAATFALWGDGFEKLFNQEKSAEWFSRAKPVAWLIAIGLLVSDLLLPIPATGVMAALGSVYGVPLGAAIAVVGSTGSALVAYALARLAGAKAGRFIAGEEEMDRFRTFFERWGGAGIVVSRALPILPEVMSVLAGLARMTFGRFLAAVFLGTVPTCVLFAYIGAASVQAPWFGVLIASVLPLLLWPVFLRLVRPGGR